MGSDVGRIGQLLPPLPYPTYITAMYGTCGLSVGWSGGEGSSHPALPTANRVFTPTHPILWTIMLKCFIMVRSVIIHTRRLYITHAV